MVRRAAEDGARRRVRRADRGRIWVISRRRSGSCSSSITVSEPWPVRARQKRHINDRDPRTRFEGGFGRRSAAAGARSLRTLPTLRVDLAPTHVYASIGNDSLRARTTCDARRTRTSYSAQTRATARRRLRGAHGSGGARIWAPSSSYRWARAVEHSLALDPTCFYAASKSYVDVDGPKPTRSRTVRGRRSRLYPRTFSLSTLQVHGFATPRAFRRWLGHLRRTPDLKRAPLGALRVRGARKRAKIRKEGMEI